MSFANIDDDVIITTFSHGHNNQCLIFNIALIMISKLAYLATMQIKAYNASITHSSL